MAVLLAKAQAMLKRSAAIAQPEPAKAIHFGDVEIERGSGRVYRGGDLVKLKPLEQKLLLYLYSNRGRRVTKGELLENVWGDSFVGEGTLSVHIRHLREKLEDDPQNPRYIKTMWGSGYMFEARE
jgi:two-component system response regulator RegX3